MPSIFQAAGAAKVLEVSSWHITARFWWLKPPYSRHTAHHPSLPCGGSDHNLVYLQPLSKPSVSRELAVMVWGTVSAPLSGSSLARHWQHHRLHQRLCKQHCAHYEGIVLLQKQALDKPWSPHQGKEESLNIRKQVWSDSCKERTVKDA